ncbi:unnamed protein product [Callosobruchus maculatus]|uniref:Uncharacterized protein n=1 Tax=Callosobruchus maculatus TaxID=64391 RepID=A0A653BYI3_CALMS|nr:unnamed protein product [Callosobruchus maculatus]
MTGLKRKRRNDLGPAKYSARNSLIQWTRPAYKGTNGSGLKVLCKKGSFTADNTTVEEAALDDQVVRIPLYRLNLNDFRKKYEVWLREQKSIESKNRTEVNKPQVKSRGKSKESTYKKTTERKSIERQKVNQHKLDRPGTHNAVKRNLKIKMFSKPKIASSLKQVKTLTKKKNVQSHARNGKINNPKDDKITKHDSKRKPSYESRKRKNNSAKKPVSRNCSIMNEAMYYLKIRNNGHISDLEHDLFNFKFSELVTQVKDVKLPSPTWKIKVMVKKGKVTSIIFTNKLELERSVSFYADKDTYKMVINNKPVALLGSPGLLNDLEDTEILLDIIQNIDPHNSMILYK